MAETFVLLTRYHESADDTTFSLLRLPDTIDTTNRDAWVEPVHAHVLADRDADEDGAGLVMDSGGGFVEWRDSESGRYMYDAMLVDVTDLEPLQTRHRP